MMEHIRQYDWCSSQPDENFLSEDDIDNCAIERIIRNTFHDPMLSSDSEDERAKVKPKLDWNQIFKRNDNETGSHFKIFVAGFRPPPPYPKLSALTKQQHYQCLKVLCSQNPSILAMEFLPRPTKSDHRVYQEVKEIYLKEQQEYIEWAKSLWISNHNIRALRPKPITENIYEAGFKMRASNLESFPKNFEMAAHISMDYKENRCEMVFKQDIVKVNIADLPKVEYPDPLLKKFTIMKVCPVPEPCNKHPCWFILPNEKEMSVLPLTEINRELAQHAAERGAQLVASEGALKCLLQLDTDWMIPVTVCQVISADGDKNNVLILGSEFSTHRKSAMARNYKAFRHLLEYALIPLTEKTMLRSKEVGVDAAGGGAPAALGGAQPPTDDDDDDDDDWFGNLIINEDTNDAQTEKTNSKQNEDESTDNLNAPDKANTNNEHSEDKNASDKTNEQKQNTNNEYSEDENAENFKTSDKTNEQKQEINNIQSEDANTEPSNTKDKTDNKKQPGNGDKKDKSGFYTCTCADSTFEFPPLRSFRKWQVKNYKNNDEFNMIVHCSHKMKGKTGQEVISEPIIEYQVDMGGSKQSNDKIKSLALSLFLRRHASLLNVRVDSASGEVVTIDTMSLEDLTKQQSNNNMMQDISNVIFETVSQLQSLLPGHYILQHEPSQGANCFLYASRVRGDGNKLNLNFDCAVLAEADEAKSLKTPPVLTNVLLPVHKFRKILPCAFTPFENMIAKEPKKPPARSKAPPRALQWPKRKQKNKKRNFK